MITEVKDYDIQSPDVLIDVNVVTSNLNLLLNIKELRDMT